MSDFESFGRPADPQLEAGACILQDADEYQPSVVRL
jgi:hypothetical protein